MTRCGNNRVFGGAGRLGKNSAVQRTFTGLPNHTSLRVTGTYFLIDCWEKGKQFFIRVDGRTIVTRDVYHWVNLNVTNICGDSREGCGDEAVPFTIELNHTDPTLTVQFTTSGISNANDESWGINNVRIELRSGLSTSKKGYEGRVVSGGKCEEECKLGEVVLNG